MGGPRLIVCPMTLPMDFEVVGDISGIETIPRIEYSGTWALRKRYGQGRWRKMKIKTFI